MNDPRHPMCPKCHGHSRYVSRAAVFPKQKLTLERLFHCAPCKTYARADREGVPLEGMGAKKLHELRQEVIERLTKSGLSKTNLQAEMLLRPWEMDFLFWDQPTCVRAINTVLPKGPKRKKAKALTAKELLS